MIASLFNPAGGWNYHKKAFKYSQSLWTPFRAQIQQHLREWITTLSPAHKTLILIGASGGYCLPLQELSSFRLVVIDPDPIARFIFKMRFRRFNSDPAALTMINADLLIKPVLKSAECADWNDLMELFPNSAVIFCNFWGQVGTLTKKQSEVIEFWKSKFASQGGNPANRPRWFSFHDRVSTTDLKAKLKEPLLNSTHLKNEVLIDTFFHPESGTVTDHNVSDLFDPITVKAYLPWQLDQNQFHIIEVAGV